MLDAVIERRLAGLSRLVGNTPLAEGHYRTTGPELWRQLKFEGAEADTFATSVGTSPPEAPGPATT